MSIANHERRLGNPGRTIVVAGAVLTLAAVLCVAFPPRLRAASTGTAGLYTPSGSGAATASGDYISSTGGINTFYSYFVEVPSGLSRLRIQIFDADIGIGGAGEAAAGRDRDREAAGWETTATYSLIDPSGATRQVRFTTGDSTQPTGSDNAWLDLYNGTGNNVRDNFGTAAYNNNDGNNNWATNWTETSDDGSATTGAIRITGGELRLQDGVAGTPQIQREADLLGSPGLNMQSAYLSFDYRTSNTLEGTDQISVEVSANGGGSWTTLETFSDDSSGSRTYDITAFIANNTRVRFIFVGGYNAADEFFFVDNLQIHDGGTIANGHWEVRVDQTGGGGDINAFGLRADDGDATSSGTELPVYYHSHNAFGVNLPHPTTRSYTTYPYITSGCTFTRNDFDYDSNNGATGSVGFSSRTAAFTQSFASGTLSVNNVWASGTVTGWVTDQLAVDYGIWTMTPSITTYTGNGNYSNIYLGNYNAVPAVTTAPTANPQTDTFRVYLPTDAGAAPVKPYLEQLLTAGGAPNVNPPAVGSTTKLVVTVRLVNPTSQSITFSATNLVTVNVPGPATAVTYQGSATVTQGSVVSQPAIGGTGNITWNPGTVAAGATVLLAFKANITPTVAGQRITVTATPASGNGTRATFVDETGNTTQTRATYTLGPVCELAATVGVITPVVVGSVTAASSRAGTVVTWTTASEAATAAFELERLQSDGSYRKVHSGVVRGLLSAPQGGVYRVLDSSASAGQETYRLVEIDVTGKRTLHGPYVVKIEETASSIPDASRGYDANPKAATLARLPAAAPAKGGATVTNPAARIEIGESGIYTIAVDDLATAMGVKASDLKRSIATGGVALTLRGVPVLWTPSIKGEGITFYGEALDSLYSKNNVYFLRVGRGVRMGGELTGKITPAASPAPFPSTAHAEENRVAAVVLPVDAESDYWFWDSLDASDPVSNRKTFTVDAADLVTTGGGAELRVRLQGATTTGVTGEHHVRVSLNGGFVGEARWEGIAGTTATFAVLPPALVAVGNSVELEAVLDPGVANSVVFLDHIELTYPRRYQASAQSLEFDDGGNAVVTVGGFTDSAIQVFDITQPTAPTRVTPFVDSASGSFRASLFPKSAHRYVAASQAGIKAPVRVSTSSGGGLGLASNGADYLVIAPSELATGAKSLAAWRIAQGLSARVVVTDEIFDEFGFGLRDPHAIAKLLTFATQYWSPKPRYAVLVGAGNYDYRDLLGFGANLVPPLLISTSGGLFPSDQALADANGDGLPELAIGRIPARTAAELQGYIDKLKLYETTPAGTSGKALLLADDAEGSDFAADAARLGSRLPPVFSQTSLSLGATSLPAARTQVFGQWGSGLDWVGFVGHGGLDRMAAEGLLLETDAASLLSSVPLRKPVVTAFTCMINRFGVPGFTSLGEALVNQAHGGASAVFAPSGLSQHSSAMQLGDRLVQNTWQEQTPRLGDALRTSLSQFLGLGGSLEMARLSQLLGDPALRVAHPQATPGVATGTGE